MKILTTKTILILLLSVSTGLFSQSKIDYDKLLGLIFKDPNKATLKSMSLIIEEYEKQGLAREFLSVAKDLKNIQKRSKVEGFSVLTKCLSLARSASYYKKSADRTDAGIKDDKRKMSSASTEYMREIYRQRYNNGIDRLRENENKIRDYVRRYESCVKSQERKYKRLDKKYSELKSELYQLYKDNYRDF